MEQLKQGKVRTFTDCFRLEFQLVQNVLAQKDFREGVQAALVEKRPPQWDPKSLQDISLDQVLRIYFHQKAEKELQLKPEMVKPVNRRFALPTEEEIIRVLQGDDGGSGSGKMTLQELESWFSRQWQGKLWVREKVKDAVGRIACSDSNGFLSTKSLYN